MTKEKTELQKRIQSGKPILIAEISPPTGSDPWPISAAAKQYAGKVHALAVNDNRDHLCMSALAAGCLVASEGIEPIVHVTTRDRNRIALLSDCLGAQAMGMSNLLCTSGTHQTLGQFRCAKSVFDIDPIHLLEAISGLASDAALVGQDSIDNLGPFCLGAAACVYGDPLEMQVLQLGKKVNAGAQFLVTEPVFDLERFDAWFKLIKQQGIDKKVAILACIKPLTNAQTARAYAEKRPLPMVPQAMLKRIASKTKASAQADTGIQIALETIKYLSDMEGLRGFAICSDNHDEVLDLIEKSGLGIN